MPESSYMDANLKTNAAAMTAIIGHRRTNQFPRNVKTIEVRDAWRAPGCFFHANSVTIRKGPGGPAYIPSGACRPPRTLARRSITG